MRALIEEVHGQVKALTGLDLAPQDWAATPNRDLGDVAIPCFKLSKALGKAPPLLAQELAAKWISKPDGLVAKVVATGPYLNVFAKPIAAFEFLKAEQKRDPKRFGGSKVGEGKTMCIDFSSPNVAKEIGLHHLRSTAIGNALSKIFALHGYKVARINYLGDWGTSFGKLIEAYKTEARELGGGAAVEAKLRAEGLPFMLDLYVRYNQAEKENAALSDAAKAAFQKLEAGDAEYRKIWQLFRDVSVEEFKKLYKRLGVDFDHFDGESLYESRLDAAVKEVTDKIGTRISDGALICELPGHKVPVLLKKDDGASLYITRDIVAAEDRWDRFKYDVSLYTVAIQQKLHFQQLFDILKLLGKPFAARCEHVSFGMLSFGSKTMKSREGNMIFLKDALDEGKKKAAEIIRDKNPELANADEVAEMVGMGAIVFFDLSQHRNHDVKFEWEKALSFEGDTSPFIQYTHARCNSLLAKGEAHLASLLSAPGVGPASGQAELDALFGELAVRGLVGEIFSLYTAAERALNERDPSQIATACLNVAKGFSHLYHKVHFLKETSPARLRALLDLTILTRDTLKHGLGLLGVRAPEEM